MAVFVLDKRHKPLMPCSEKRARILLERGRARVHRMVPFTIRLVDRLREDSVLQELRVSITPGSKATGLAVTREAENVDPATGEVIKARVVLMLLELQHRGHAIRDKLTSRRAFRRRRRNQLRHRPARFDNRTKPDGWLAPSLQHRVDTVMTWVQRLLRWTPVASLSTMLHRFDTQALQNPEISGAEYQQGELQGYEVREYLLEKWGRKCAYCDAEHTALTIDHIHPKSKGGSDRVSNLTLACFPCNQRKNHQDVRDFLAKDPQRLARIEAVRKAPLKDAAAVNSTRWALWERLKETHLPVEVGTGGRTKWNRKRLNIPKTHSLDAICTGRVDDIQDWRQPVLTIKATGRGSYQRTRLTKHGFPRGYLTRSKSAFGFQTGDMVKAIVTTGKKAGIYLGRVAIRASGSFNIQSVTGLVQGIHHRFCTLIQRTDGYGYMWTKIASTKGDAEMGRSLTAALSLPGLAGCKPERRGFPHNRMKFATDADQVLFNFDATWRTVGEDVLNRALPLIRPLKYDLSARYALTNREYHRIWAAFNALGLWEHVQPMPGAVDTIKMLLDMGHEVHVISSVPDHAIPYRERQLEKLFGQALVFHPSQNGFSGHDAKPEKSVFLKAIRPMFYADDCWPHCLEARYAHVPYIARIDGAHGGNGEPVDGVHVHDGLAEAVKAFFASFTSFESHPKPAVYGDFSGLNRLKKCAT
ncbi:RNA-guided endonuclease IscB [Acidithiobacillus sp. M4-SHS-6]|uniref:RNA-guided endonuclease IscB n=1 Tax=Acidithiobacillus sp. M4-SHS-6 TaxID=3383024 RepID=UPI0039BEAE3C